ncbi:cobyrinic acid a,c-diamide synthase [Robbsia andropogonis]|uniref:Cobyrinic acid a,c-diamide synthase n=1 Tax=Robbsia andropogonis TaxID=28092 RepID=A0A0F5JVB1_9BURK|nr:AAA family ATPase [Robbsia andropogonis]KKB61806.1 cobyrinic acid a,c-diamide synthase [Robbsia andropogonis]MCP1121223.1 AAA family ATPase [Robbsia andropogonis]MCP1131042.1 AAA family ATPase [Robbsia andropogonis]
MAAKIITVFNQKGGAGKTLVSCHLAETLALRGNKSLLVDLDPQGTATIWASMSSEDRPVKTTAINLSMMASAAHREIRKFVADYDYIVIDCPPAIQSVAPSVALLVSDLALIPVGGSGGNLWAIEEAKKLAATAMANNESLKVRTLPNMYQNISIVKQVFQHLSEDPSVPMLKSRLGLRAAFKEAETTGQSVHTISGGKDAVREVNSLVDEVLALI